MKRSNAPIFWLMFGAGGMLAALFGTALVFITGLAAPLGVVYKSSLLSYAKVLGFAQSWYGKGFLFAVIMFFAWHAVHRIYHSLHDIGIHGGALAKLVCYGSAAVVTVVGAMSLLKIGF